VGISLDKPKILQSKVLKKAVNHDPLKPVWPVIIIFLFLNVFIKDIIL
jgi:hypothetical protein